MMRLAIRGFVQPALSLPPARRGIASGALAVAAPSGKLIQFGTDARETMLRGIERIAKAVGVTLGPKGRNVIFRLPDGEPKITKDGVTVARSIGFRNEFEDLGAKLIRQVASKTNDVAGDGTTTSTILAWNIFTEGYKSIATGANPMDLKRGIDIAVAEILRSLTAQMQPVNDLDTLVNVATISANGERPLGLQIATAVHTVGPSGYIGVMNGHTSTTTWERHDGWSTETGFVSSELVTDKEKLLCELHDSLLFVARDPLEVDSCELVLSLLGEAKQQGKPITIVAPQIADAIREIVVLNHRLNVVQCCLVTPRAEDTDLNVLEDLAVSCGTHTHGKPALSTSAESCAALLGHATKVFQSMDCSIVVGNSSVVQRVRFLEQQLSRVCTEQQSEKLRERIAKLTKRFAVIRVGGRSQVEIAESMDRVIDALNASRAALQEGIVAGGGAALLHATKALEQLLDEDATMEQDKRTGIQIVRNAGRLPAKMIADNAGVEGAVIVENLVSEAADTHRGYDAQNDEYKDMFAAGIVDPTRVVRCCITDAASVAGLMITTEASVCEDEPKNYVSRP